MKTDIPITRVEVAAYRIPTDYPEADGTVAWDATTMVVVHVDAGGKTGLGFGYADTATAVFIQEILTKVVEEKNAMAPTRTWVAMTRAIRNHGRSGIASMAISAVDIALWELKAKLLDLPLVSLLGAVRDGMPVYGSGGFTSYPVKKLQEQLGHWVAMGIPRVKMKIGTHPDDDLQRVQAAREAIGPRAELFVDANGAYSRKQALAMADRFAPLGVTWFEEPVSSDDVPGLRLLRDRAPAGMDIATGEYGYDLYYFRRLFEAQAVDVMQADVTRCGGVTGMLQAGDLCDAYEIPFSGHTAPSIHMHVCASIPRARHLEYFHDHARIEAMLFDGFAQPVNGVMSPDLSRPGLGLELKQADAQRYAV